MTGTQPARDLTPFFDPRSVAVVGASDSAGKWGHAIAMGALRGASRRSVYLVNRSGGAVLGQPTYRSLEDVPEAPELVVLAVPMSAFDVAVDSALARGAKAIVAINAGFAEVGTAGADHQLELVRRVRSAGSSLIGPNCMGVVDNDTDLDVSWILAGSMSAGAVGVISQSGNLGYDISWQLNDVGIGISRWVSLGNQADVSVTDLIRSFASHERTRLIAIYCEELRDGRAFLHATQAAVGAGKPVIVLAPGGNEAAARAARSHTGALTTDDAVLDAVCRACGAIRVATPTELVDTAQLLLRPARSRGRRLAILSDGGGHAVIATNVGTAAGLKVEPFSDELRRALWAATDPTAGTANPVDLASSNTDPTAMERVIREVVQSGEADGIVITGGFGSLELVDPELGRQELDSAKEIARIVNDAQLPTIAHTVSPGTTTNVVLRDAGVPVFREIERGVNALCRVIEAAEHPAEQINDLAPEPDPPDVDGYFGARRLLAAAGLAFPEALAVENVTEALAAAGRIGYPVVLKAVSLLHKSDAGGVALDLADPESLRTAFGRMDAATPDGRYSVEAMVQEPDGVELVIGCRRDPHFGPVLLIGLGGIYTEVLRDFKLLLAPAAPVAVERVLGSLRGAPLLDGLRGHRAVDLGAVCLAAARVSEVAAAHPSIAEIEVNPLLAHPGGATALDSRIVRDAAVVSSAAG